MQPGMTLGTGGVPPIKNDLAKAQFTTTPLKTVDAVDAANKAPEAPREPPKAVLEALDEKPRAAFIRLWKRVPPHLHDIQFDFDKALRTETNIDTLGDLLCKYEHRFSRHSTDLGHVTVDPFRALLKINARPVKQRPYRHFPVLAAKVQTEIDKLALTGILRRSYSNWSSPLIVIAKLDGKTRIACNYKRLNKQPVIPVFPLPTEDDLLLIADLGGAQIFSTMDLVRIFF